MLLERRPRCINAFAIRNWTSDMFTVPHYIVQDSPYHDRTGCSMIFMAVLARMIAVPENDIAVLIAAGERVIHGDGHVWVGGKVV